MDGEQAHGVGRLHRCGLDAAGLERAHETVGGEEPPAILRERLGQQVAQLCQHGAVLADGHRLRKTRQHIPMVVQRRERVVRRQAVQPAAVQGQALRGLAQAHGLGGLGHQRGLLLRRQGREALQHLPPRRPRRWCGARLLRRGPSQAQSRELGQVVVAPAAQRRLQRARQAEVVPGGHQRVQQRHHVLHGGRFGQVELLGLFAQDASLAQGLVHPAQALAPPCQHHDVARAQAPVGDLQRHPVGRLRGFERGQAVFGQHPRRDQAVAPRGFANPTTSALAQAARQLRQAQHLAVGRALGGVLAVVAAVLARQYGSAHGGIERIDHGRRAAARVVAAEQRARQALHHEGLRGLEHLWFGAAEAVDRLLGVAHQEDAGRLARAGAGVGGEPAVERLPLQGVGVLELVDQHMAQARVQPLLHPARELGIAQQAACGAFHVVHVDPAALALEGGEAGQQHARQARHALVVLPGALLAHGLERAQGQLLCGTHCLDARQLVVELARLVLLRQQGRERTRAVAGAQRLFEFNALGGKGGSAGTAQCLSGLAQQRGGTRVLHQPLRGALAVGELGVTLGHGFDRGSHHAAGVGQRELHALAERLLQRLEGLVAAVFGHTVHEVLPRRRVGHQRGVKARPDLGHGLRVVFQQLVLHRQPQFLQHGQGRTAQQRGEPAVEGAHLHRAAQRRHARMQASGLAVARRPRPGRVRATLP